MPKIKVGRVSLNGNHIYSIVVTNNRAELLLPTGKKRWSTISQSLLSRIWNSASLKDEINGDTNLIFNEILFNLNVSQSRGPNASRWKVDKVKIYWNFDSAMEKEQKIINKNVSNRGMDEQYQ